MHIKDLFFQKGNSKHPIHINFKIKVIDSNDAERSLVLQFMPDDDRWVQKEIDGKQIYYNEVEDVLMSIDDFVEGFNRYKKIHGHNMPIGIKQFNTPKGTTQVRGVKNLIRLKRNEEAFLSCHGIFRHRVRVLVFFLSTNLKEKVDAKEWEEFKKKHKNTGPLINKLEKLLKQSNIVFEHIQELRQFNRNRNEVDHGMGEGKIDHQLLFNTTKDGVYRCEELEKLFSEIK